MKHPSFAPNGKIKLFGKEGAEWAETHFWRATNNAQALLAAMNDTVPLPHGPVLSHPKLGHVLVLVRQKKVYHYRDIVTGIHFDVVIKRATVPMLPKDWKDELYD